jgi:hypothetical protein
MANMTQASSVDVSAKRAKRQQQEPLLKPAQYKRFNTFQSMDKTLYSCRIFYVVRDQESINTTFSTKSIIEHRIKSSDLPKATRAIDFSSQT